MTTTFTITYNVPDANVADILACWQVVYPKLNGETNLNYVKRITQIWGVTAYKAGKDYLNAQAASIADPGIITS
jgi:hypothetical protein